MSSAQQNQFTSGQHPAGHIVPPLLLGSHLDKLLLHCNKWTVSSSSCTVHVIWAAEPVLLWTASSWAHCSITLLLGSHLDKLLLHCNKWTVSSSSSTVHVIWAAEPVLFWT